jgi:predicted outer membrane repeat protein
MLRTVFALAAVALCSSVFVPQSLAGPLTSAEVTKIINRVSVIEPTKGNRPAALRDVIKDDLGLQTGTKSRSELLFQDYTLTRLGAETFFSFKTGTRDLTLEKGSMLLQVPKGLGGAKIHTAAVTAAITGTTIMMEYRPKQYLKVLVLEGSLRLSRNGSLDSQVLRPGKMVIMRPDAKKIPEPIDVDLAEIVKTSTLVNFPGSNILPSMPLIQTAINDQARELTKGTLVATNLVMGGGTNVVLASKDQLNKAIGSLTGLATIHNGASVTGTVSASTNNVLGSGPAVSVSSSDQIVSLLGNTAPGSGGAINVTPGAVSAGGNVTGAVKANTGGVNVNAGAGGVNAGANVSVGGTLPTPNAPPIAAPPPGH